MYGLGGPATLSFGGLVEDSESNWAPRDGGEFFLRDSSITERVLELRKRPNYLDGGSQAALSYVMILAVYDRRSLRGRKGTARWLERSVGYAARDIRMDGREPAFGRADRFIQRYYDFGKGRRRTKGRERLRPVT